MRDDCWAQQDRFTSSFSSIEHVCHQHAIPAHLRLPPPNALQRGREGWYWSPLSLRRFVALRSILPCTSKSHEYLTAAYQHCRVHSQCHPSSIVWDPQSFRRLYGCAGNLHVHLIACIDVGHLQPSYRTKQRGHEWREGLPTVAHATVKVSNASTESLCSSTAHHRRDTT